MLWAWFIFLKIGLPIRGLLWFCMNSRITFSISGKEPLGYSLICECLLAWPVLSFIEVTETAYLSIFHSKYSQCSLNVKKERDYFLSSAYNHTLELSLLKLLPIIHNWMWNVLSIFRIKIIAIIMLRESYFLTLSVSVASFLLNLATLWSMWK